MPLGVFSSALFETARKPQRSRSFDGIALMAGIALVIARCPYFPMQMQLHQIFFHNCKLSSELRECTSNMFQEDVGC